MTETMSVGYYVGGMKKKGFENIRDKDGYFSNLFNGGEALDIKTLTTLFLLTPRQMFSKR